MSDATQIGVIQMCATANVSANMHIAAELTGKAVAAGAKVVFWPEAFSYIGSDRDRREILESLDQGGPILDACKNQASKHGIDLVVGGFHEAAPDGKAYNSCIHINPDGKMGEVYRKIHLFDVDLPDGTRMFESRATLPGDRAVVAELPFGSLGLTVCYDIRFPNLYQRLCDLGAIAIAIPAAFTKTTGRDHWHVLLRARAIECQAYVIAAAQYGNHQHRNRQSFGHALVVDPWGNIVAECEEDQDSFAVATIDPREVEKVRQQLPSLNNRRAWT